MLRRVEQPTGVAAEFAVLTLRVGQVWLKGRTVLCLLNWQDGPQTLSVRLPGQWRVMDLWSGKDLGRHEGIFEVRDMPGHSGQLLVCDLLPRP